MCWTRLLVHRPVCIHCSSEGPPAPGRVEAAREAIAIGWYCSGNPLTRDGEWCCPSCQVPRLTGHGRQAARKPGTAGWVRRRLHQLLCDDCAAPGPAVATRAEAVLEAMVIGWHCSGDPVAWDSDWLCPACLAPVATGPKLHKAEPGQLTYPECRDVGLFDAEASLVPPARATGT